MHVFDDPFALFEQDRVDERGERRWQAIGLTAEVVRLISARLATRKEQSQYEQSRAQDLGG